MTRNRTTKRRNAKPTPRSASARERAYSDSIAETTQQTMTWAQMLYHAGRKSRFYVINWMIMNVIKWLAFVLVGYMSAMVIAVQVLTMLSRDLLNALPFANRANVSLMEMIALWGPPVIFLVIILAVVWSVGMKYLYRILAKLVAKARSKAQREVWKDRQKALEKEREELERSESADLE